MFRPPTCAAKYLVFNNREEDKIQLKVSFFLLHKDIIGRVGPVVSIMNLQNGSFLVDTGRKMQNLSLISSFSDLVKVLVEPHRSLNYSRGVIICSDLLHIIVVDIKDTLAEKPVI